MPRTGPRHRQGRTVGAEQSAPGGTATAIPGGRFAQWHVEPAEDSEGESWLLVYLDVMTLLLVMFVVMLAFTEEHAGVPEQEPGLFAGQAGVPSVLEGEWGPLHALPEAPAPEDPTTEQDPADPAMADELDALGDDIDVLVEAGSISFRISDEILFPSGEADLTDRGLEVLGRLIPVLQASDHRITVEGHTDDVPIATERFPSNWELATGRATRVVRFLQGQGIAATRLQATGLADTRPIADNATEEGRAQNRRVELVLQTDAD